MANNDFVRIEFGRDIKVQDQIVYKDLESICLNTIGTSYKGPAFVPKILYNQPGANDENVSNTITKLFGTHRQNRYAHLYDDYSYNADSDAYDSLSAWFANGGTYAYFTRVLGIGNGIKNITTGKMSGSGFNVSKNISSGSLTNKNDSYLNSVDSNDNIPGFTSFFTRTINMRSESATRNGLELSNPYLTNDTLDYFYELGLSGIDKINILTDTVFFASGVLPNFEASVDDAATTGIALNDNAKATTTSHEEASSIALEAVDQLNQVTILPDSVFIDLRGLKTKVFELSETTDEGEQEVKAVNKSVEINEFNSIEKSSLYYSQAINEFPEKYFDKGHLRYSTFPTTDLHNALNTTPTTTTMLFPQTNSTLSKEIKEIVPDYSSFECEYQTAKTPWVTSQPIDRDGFGVKTTDDQYGDDRYTSTNRIDIHKKVINLFRFWSLDDGEVGNRFRIKINIKKCGDSDINNIRDHVSATSSDPYALFDIFVYEYDARVNAFLDEDNTTGPVESFTDVNLNPDSDLYIGRVIGTNYERYDFDSGKIIQKGMYANTNKYIRVEISSAIDEKTLNKQHMLLPSGFRSYPHIRLRREAFNNVHHGYPVIGESNDLTRTAVDLTSMFDNASSTVLQLPPLYALNYYPDESGIANISNNWGVVFTPPKITDNFLTRESGAGDINKQKISPHYFYSKYYLSGIEKRRKQKNKNLKIFSEVTFNTMNDNETLKIYYVDKSVGFIEESEKYLEVVFIEKTNAEYTERFTNTNRSSGYKIKIIDAESDDSFVLKIYIVIESTIKNTLQHLNDSLNEIFSDDAHDGSLGFIADSVTSFSYEVDDDIFYFLQKEEDKLEIYAKSRHNNMIINNYFLKNVWVEKDNYLNSFFHLEKIIFRNSKDINGDYDSNFDAGIDNISIRNMQYKHSGGHLLYDDSAPEVPNLDIDYDFEYINLDSALDTQIWSNDRLLKTDFRDKLSFDFFTYGGFDGVDIRDSDKRFLRSDAVTRELNEEEAGSKINGATYNSYLKAIDIATDEANADSDILLVPGIKAVPILQKCLDICESSKNKIFIVDVSAACVNSVIEFHNQTVVTNPNREEGDEPIYSSEKIKQVIGISGRHFIVKNELSEYVRDKQSYRSADDRFILTNINEPDTGDVLDYYSYEKVLKGQYENVINEWLALDITSRYVLPVYGDTIAADADTGFKKKICPEVYVLGNIAATGLRENITGLQSPALLQYPGVNFSLINEDMMNTSYDNFENDSKRFKEANINFIYQNSEASSITLASANTAYATRGSLFKDLGIVRTLNQIKKRLRLDIFSNSTLIPGGFLFSQSANINNVYQKLEIQLNILLSSFVEENLITSYNVNINKTFDDEVIADMQNYIVRGSIVLQMNNNDIIDLKLSDILASLSMMSPDSDEPVFLPSSLN